MNKIFCLYETIPGEVQSNDALLDKVRDDYWHGRITLNEAREMVGLPTIKYDMVMTRSGLRTLNTWEEISGKDKE